LAPIFNFTVVAAVKREIYFQATVMIPSALMDNVKTKDFLHLLEAQRTEQLLIDMIATTSTPDISNQYYSQVLMAQRLQRAEVEVALYRHAIARDGLYLLSGMRYRMLLIYMLTK
jgi:hypothetical protein